MKNKSNKKVTLENVAIKVDKVADNVDKLTYNLDALAVTTKRGFDNVHGELKEFKDEMHEFKDEMHEFKNKTEESLFNLNSHANQTNDRLDAIEKTLGPLVHVSSIMQKEIRSLNTRVDRLEKIISHK